jgi:hypothetical protein
LSGAQAVGVSLGIAASESGIERVLETTRLRGPLRLIAATRRSWRYTAGRSLS